MRCRLGEVDVVSETNLARTVQQPKQRSPFGCSASTADDNDDAMVRPRRCEMEKVVPVQVNSTQPCSWANWRTASSRESPGKALRKSDIVAELHEQVTQSVRHVVVEQELHSEASAVCLATSKSISPRWSS